MNDNLAKFCTMLRSGLYKQNRRLLRNREGGFCAQGVACDMHDNTRWKLVHEKGYTDPRWKYRSENEAELECVWPPEVSEALGIHGRGSDLTRLIWIANDIGMDFPTIADMIEAWDAGDETLNIAKSGMAFSKIEKTIKDWKVRHDARIEVDTDHVSDSSPAAPVERTRREGSEV